ncbi:MAG: hypothetical protein IJS38_03850 [Erysipelotrichaceae bacterium]|nr:hypothetical protein [Erysipelotrichaceae bacterium]
MKKTIMIIIAAAILLTGCSSKPQQINTDKLEKVITAACEVELPEALANNARKKYYSYYLPKGAGNHDRDATSNLFSLYGNKAILNLDVAGILSSTYYGTGQEEELRDIDMLAAPEYNRTGTCLNSSGREIRYSVSIASINDSDCYVLIQTVDFIFVAVCRKVESDEMVQDMMKIIRSCSPNVKTVIDDYSNVDPTHYTTRTISLFREILPESGKVSDYLDDWKNDPAFVLIDTTDKESDKPSESDIEENEDDEGEIPGADTGDDENPEIEPGGEENPEPDPSGEGTGEQGNDN